MTSTVRGSPIVMVETSCEVTDGSSGRVCARINNIVAFTWTYIEIKLCSCSCWQRRVLDLW